MGLFPYSNKLRAYRKTMSRVIGTKAAAAQFNSLQEAQVSHFLRHILEAPEKLVNHIRKLVFRRFQAFMKPCIGIDFSGFLGRQVR